MYGMNEIVIVITSPQREPSVDNNGGGDILVITVSLSGSALGAAGNTHCFQLSFSR